MDFIFKCATATDMEASQKKLTELYDASNAADSAYRTAKASKFISLSNPSDGSKKPSESMILATIDSNSEIIKLREAAAKASAELEVAKMMFKATIAVVTRNG